MIYLLRKGVFHLLDFRCTGTSPEQLYFFLLNLGLISATRYVCTAETSLNVHAVSSILVSWSVSRGPVAVSVFQYFDRALRARNPVGKSRRLNVVINDSPPHTLPTLVPHFVAYSSNATKVAEPTGRRMQAGGDEPPYTEVSQYPTYSKKKNHDAYMKFSIPRGCLIIHLGRVMIYLIHVPWMSCSRGSAVRTHRPCRPATTVVRLRARSEFKVKKSTRPLS